MSRRWKSLLLSALIVGAGAGTLRAQDSTDDGGAGLLPESRSERKLGGAGYSCTATNAVKDAKCSISCRSQQDADCEDADGAGTPTCRCEN